MPSLLPSPVDRTPTSEEPAIASPLVTPPSRFSKEQEEFLSDLLPAFNKYLDELAKKGTGPRIVGGVKGRQGEWIKTYVVQPFIERFNARGWSRTILTTKIKKWFWNHGDRARKQVVKVIQVPTTPPRRRATTARQRFADAFSKEINEKVKTEREKTGASSQMNLPLYRLIRDEMFHAADDTVREQYEEEARAFNARVADPPTESEIYASQKNIGRNTAVALGSLCGWDHGGHGDTVFFVLGAYRNQNSEINTFNTTIAKNIHGDGFKTRIADIETTLWERFADFAASVFPANANANDTTMPTMPYTIDDSVLSNAVINKDEDIADIPSPPDNTDEGGVDIPMSGTTLDILGDAPLPTPVALNDATANEQLETEPNVHSINILDNADPGQTPAIATPSEVNGSPPHNLTDQEVAFAITSALSSLSSPGSPVVAQGVPRKARQCKVGANKGPKLNVKLAATSTLPERKLECKRQMKIPPVTDANPPVKKVKVTEQPQKRVSARLHADGYKNKHVSVR